MKIILKAIIYLIVFSVLHFGYEVLKWPLLIIFCGTDESVFEHLKMGFWAYLIVSVIEYFLVKKKARQENFWYSRIFSAILAPWFIVVIWYMLPAIIGHVESLTVELVWAFVVTFLSAIMACHLEKNTERISLTKWIKVIIIVLFILSVVFYTRFSISKPWIDLFINPLNVQI
ncbi:DUF6512 family protein [Thermotoga profunda]|uniref:DUF6512 family protein n=1 Tax=Thermotoga profunda TaxID=1508420 RepID=UPI000A88EC2A